MKVVMIGPFGMTPKRTMAVRALPMAQALVRCGHCLVMLLPPWSNPDDAGTCFDAAGVKVVNLPLPPRIPILFHLLLSFTLLRQTLAHQPDVVHCFKPKAYAGLVACCIWQLKRLRLVRARLVIDTDDWEGAGGWNDLEPYSWPLKKIFAWQERWGLTHADALTIASRALQTLAWSLGVPPAKVFYVPNGINAPASTPSVTHLNSTATPTPTLLLYTRFFEFGLERVARLFALLAEQNPSLRLLVVGKGLFGEEKKFAHLLNNAPLRAGEGRVGERVTWLGWLPPAELPTAFARATVAIYPFDDTLLNRTKCAVKLTDLLAAGVPVVAEAVGQNAEYIVHGESGLLVRSGDEAALVAAVNQLLRDEALRQRVSEGARQRMRDHFLWDDLAHEVERAYAA